MKTILWNITVFLILSISNSIYGAENLYLLPKDTPVYDSQFRMEYGASLGSEAFKGWFKDQAKKGNIAFMPLDVEVRIIDECTWCAGPAVKVSAVVGELELWVYKTRLKKIKEMLDPKQNKFLYK